MALQKFGNITNFWNSKSIKLSDTFDVLIKYNYDENDTDYERLVSCTGFTLPKLEYEEETYEYGNVAQVFLTPKYDSCKEMTLEFIERMESNNYSVTLSKIMSLMDYKLTQNFSQDLMNNYADYNNVDTVIPELIIKIMNNKLWRYKYQYHFNNLKIVNYSMYNLDNQTESPCKITVTLSFESYKKEYIDEPVWDDNEQQTEQQKLKYDPNGQVNYDSISVNGNNYSNKEDIEMNWKNAINKKDLSMISNEQLYNPDYSEIMSIDLDDEDTPPELQTEMYKQSINDNDLASLRQRPELAELKEMDLDDDDKSSNPPIENQVAANGQMNGGYKQPALGSNGYSGGGAAANASQKATQKAELANKQEKQVASGKKTYRDGMTASDLGKSAAQLTKKYPNGTYKTAALNEVGLDAKARKEVETSYNAEMKKKS